MCGGDGRRWLQDVADVSLLVTKGSLRVPAGWEFVGGDQSVIGSCSSDLKLAVRRRECVDSKRLT